MAADPDARSFLQSGPNVIFDYQGKVIAVQDTGNQSQDPNATDEEAGQHNPDPDPTGGETARLSDRSAPRDTQRNKPTICLAPYAVTTLLGLAAVVAKNHFFKPRLG